MAEITLRNITKRWGKYYAVDNLDLDIADNSFITLLGPSGCGKTTILRMIAGLETPTTGQIKIGNRVVFDSEEGINIPANKRKVGFLFQNYALWPNMTVYQNIAFGLNNIKEPMPKYCEEARITEDLIRALKNGKKLAELVADCKDKKGKIDLDKVYLKFIDSFTLSLHSAKTLYGYKIHLAENPDEAAVAKTKELEAELEGIKAACKAKGYTLGEDNVLLSEGKEVVVERKLSKEEVDKAIRRVARIVKIGMFMDRYPAELSGGQQQRVAIARTLAPEPEVLFMDEPLSNLDAKLRLEMRYELQRLHLETGSTFVYVTHDQMEAMTLATKICLVNNGVLQQYAAPLEVYNKPDNLFVADFVGNPSINFIDVRGIQNPDGSIGLAGLDGIKFKFIPNEAVNLKEWQAERDASAKAAEAELEESLKSKKAVEKSNKDERFKYNIAKVDDGNSSLEEDEIPTDDDFILGIRPEFLQLGENGSLKTTVYGAMPTGMESTVKLRVGNYLLTGVIFGGVTFQLGSEMGMDFKGNGILLYDRKSGRCITTGSLELIK